MLYLFFSVDKVIEYFSSGASLQSDYRLGMEAGEGQELRCRSSDASAGLLLVFSVT